MRTLLSCGAALIANRQNRVLSVSDAAHQAAQRAPDFAGSALFFYKQWVCSNNARRPRRDDCV